MCRINKLNAPLERLRLMSNMYPLKSGGSAVGDLADASIVFGIAAVSSPQRRLSIGHTVTSERKNKPLVHFSDFSITVSLSSLELLITYQLFSF